MASAPTSSPLRQMLEGQLSRLSNEVEQLFDEARVRARRDLADQLNQAVRRLRQAITEDEIGATLFDAAAPFASGVALFRVEDQTLRGQRARGIAHLAALDFETLEMPLSAAAALAGAVESRDPVTTITTPSEISGRLMTLFGHASDGRAQLFPIVTPDRVPAILYTWGSVQGPPLELLAQVAAAVWPIPETEPEPEPEPARELVTIAPLPVAAPAEPAPAPEPARTAATWESLPAEEQAIHLRAQRFARVQVAELRLNEPAAVQSGRAQSDLYSALRERIDAARVTMRQTFFAQCPSMVDYLHVELVRTLAHENQDLLGKDYPGPLV